MRYWEASAIVPLLVEESASADRRALLRADSEIATWWGTYVECESALCRLDREGAGSDRIWAARDRLNAFANSWVDVQPTESIRRHAMALLRIHPLRAADALQLAAALLVAERRSDVAAFVCNDQRLTSAARREGLTTI